MTPIASFLARVLPKPLIFPALALSYAVLDFAILASLDSAKRTIHYVDVHEGLN